MSKVTLTTIQRDAFREVVATGTSKAKEATVKALLRRNLIEPDGDGFALTKAGKAFLELDAKERAAQAATKTAEKKATKPVKLAETGPVTVTVEDPSKDLKANAAAAGQTDAKVKTERLTKVEKPKAAPVDKDGTIRVAKQIRTFVAGHAVGTDPLAKRIAKAELAKDESVRIPVSDADLDVLRGWAVAMADADNLGRGDVRSARALIQWIDGMKARRAAKK